MRGTQKLCAKIALIIQDCRVIFELPLAMGRWLNRKHVVK